MFNIRGSLFFFIIIAIAIILKFEKCKGEICLIKLEVSNGTEIDIELEGNPTTGFMWYILSVTTEFPDNKKLSDIMLLEVSEENKEKKQLITNEKTNVIVSPLHRKSKEGVMQHLIGVGSTFYNNITVFSPGIYYVKYVYAKATDPPEVGLEIIFEFKVENNSAVENKGNNSGAEKEDNCAAEKEDNCAAEKEDNSAAEKEDNSAAEKEDNSAAQKKNTSTETKNFVGMNVAIESKMCGLGKTVHVAMEGNPSLGNLWYVYDVAENSAQLKTLHQNLLEEKHSQFTHKKDSNILVTDPSCENSLLYSSLLRQGCTFGSVITPKKTGTYYIVYGYKHFSSRFVQKYKFVKVIVF